MTYRAYRDYAYEGRPPALWRNEDAVFDLLKHSLGEGYVVTGKTLKKGRQDVLQLSNENMHLAMAHLLIQGGLFHRDEVPWAELLNSIGALTNSTNSKYRLREYLRTAGAKDAELGPWFGNHDKNIRTTADHGQENPLRPFDPQRLRRELGLPIPPEELATRLADATLRALLTGDWSDRWSDLDLSHCRQLFGDVCDALRHRIVQKVCESSLMEWDRAGNWVYQQVLDHGLSYPQFEALGFEADLAARILTIKPVSPSDSRARVFRSPHETEWVLARELYSAVEVERLIVLRRRIRGQLVRSAHSNGSLLFIPALSAGRLGRAPSDLLRAQNRIVPFVDLGDPACQDSSLENLVRSCTEKPGLQLAFIVGSGGSGKTRLALELLHRLSFYDNCVVGFLDAAMAADPENQTMLDSLFDSRHAVLVIDYAERWSQPAGLLRRLIDGLSDKKATIVLLVRSVESWYDQLRDDPQVGPFIRRSTRVLLRDRQLTEQDQLRLLEVALPPLARALEREVPAVQGDLFDPQYNRVLFLLIRAFQLIEGDTQEADPLKYALGREREFWKLALEAYPEPVAKDAMGALVPRAMAAITLLGGASGYEHACSVLRCAGDFKYALALWLRNLYHDGSRCWLPALEPDMLGEQLVLEEIGQDVEFLDTVLLVVTPRSFKHCLTVLTRIAGRCRGCTGWITRALEPHFTAENACIACEVAIETGRPMSDELARLVAKSGSQEIAHAVIKAVAYHAALRGLAVEAALLLPLQRRLEVTQGTDALPFWLIELGRDDEALAVAQKSLDDYSPEDRCYGQWVLWRVLEFAGRFHEAMVVAEEAWPLLKARLEYDPDELMPEILKDFLRLLYWEGRLGDILMWVRIFRVHLTVLDGYLGLPYTSDLHEPELGWPSKLFPNTIEQRRHWPPLSGSAEVMAAIDRELSETRQELILRPSSHGIFNFESFLALKSIVHSGTHHRKAGWSEDDPLIAGHLVEETFAESLRIWDIRCDDMPEWIRRYHKARRSVELCLLDAKSGLDESIQELEPFSHRCPGFFLKAKTKQIKNLSISGTGQEAEDCLASTIARYENSEARRCPPVNLAGAELWHLMSRLHEATGDQARRQFALREAFLRLLETDYSHSTSDKCLLQWFTEYLHFTDLPVGHRVPVCIICFGIVKQLGTELSKESLRQRVLPSLEETRMLLVRDVKGLIRGGMDLMNIASYGRCTTEELTALLGAVPDFAGWGENVTALATHPTRQFESIGKKVGRNEPCPCGSGKKFKKCCGDR